MYTCMCLEKRREGEKSEGGGGEESVLKSKNHPTCMHWTCTYVGMESVVEQKCWKQLRASPPQHVSEYLICKLEVCGASLRLYKYQPLH